MLFVVVGSFAVAFSAYRLVYVIRAQRFPEWTGMSYRWRQRAANPGGYRWSVIMHCMGLIMCLVVLSIWIRTGAGT